MIKYKIDKCKFYNDHRTAVVLMLDDFSPVFFSINDKSIASNDWGGLLNKDNSLYKYLENTILKKHPEIKGTIFFPINLEHGILNKNSGYKYQFNKNVEDIRDFFNNINEYFEIAFHGTNHGKYIDEMKPSINKNWLQEFQYLHFDDVARIKDQINEFEKIFGIKMLGGKYPGYLYNDISDKIIDDLGFIWWCRDLQIKKNNKYFGKNKDVFDFPTHFLGNSFNSDLYFLQNYNTNYRFLLKKYLKLRKQKIIKNIEKFYSQGIIISIQEHYQNLRTDGKRQKPNIFDDLYSLEYFYYLFRGSDVWYANCSDIAIYQENYDNTTIQIENDKFIVKYLGKRNFGGITLRGNFRKIIDDYKNSEINGIYKNDKWIFNNIKEGSYTIK